MKSSNTKPKKYYSLLTLENVHGQSKWCIQFGDFDKEVVKQEVEDSYSEYKTRIITTLAGMEHIETKVNALNQQLKDKTEKAQLSIFKISDIVQTMLQNPDYKHLGLFDNKQDAITFINNFTGYMSRNALNGKFKTSLNIVAIEEQVKYLTIFETK